MKGTVLIMKNENSNTHKTLRNSKNLGKRESIIYFLVNKNAFFMFF